MAVLLSTHKKVSRRVLHQTPSTTAIDLTTGYQLHLVASEPRPDEAILNMSPWGCHQLFEQTFEFCFFESLKLWWCNLSSGVDSLRQHGCQEVSVCLKIGSYPANSSRHQLWRCKILIQAWDDTLSLKISYGKWPHLTTRSSLNSFSQWKLVFQVPVRLQIATAQGLLEFHPWKDSWHILVPWQVLDLQNL